MEEDDFDYKFAYEQHFGALSSESGSENEEEFLRLYGNYEPLPVPIDPNNVIIVPPDELLKQCEENAVSSTGHKDEEGFITVGVQTMKNRSRNIQSLRFSTKPTKREETARQSEFLSRSTNSNQINMLPQKKKSGTIPPKKKLTKTHSAQSKKQNHKPNITTFKFNEDEFPVLPSSSNNISRPKEKMLSTSPYVPSQSKIETEVNILKNSEVFNTNQEYVTVGTALEEISYKPIKNTTKIPSLMEIEFDTSNSVVKPENEVSYLEYIRTDSDLFMQNEMKFKNEDTTKDLNGFFFDSNKSSITNIGTKKSTGTKKKKSKNKQNNAPNTFKFKEDDFPALSSSTSNVTRSKRTKLSNPCQIEAEINIPIIQEYSNTNQEYVTVGTFLEEISYPPIINTTTIPSLMETEYDTSNNAVKHQNEVSYSMNYSAGNSGSDSDLPFMQNEIKSKNEDTAKGVDSLLFDSNKSSITNIGTEKSTGAKKKKPKNKKQKNVDTSITVEEYKTETLESFSELNQIKNKLFTGNSLMDKMFQFSESVMTERKLDLINNTVLDYFNFFTLLSKAELDLLPNYIRSIIETESFKIISQCVDIKNVVIPSPVTVDHRCVELTKGNKLKVDFSGNDTSLNAPQNQLNDLQKVAITVPSPIANDYEISRCVELTEQNKLEANSNGKDIFFNDPQVPKNVAKTTKTELQLVNNMMQDTSFNNMYYYGYYSNLKAEESVASYSAVECKTLEDIPQLNDMQNVVIADSAPIAHDHEISRCVELTEEHKLEINSNLKAEESVASYTAVECKTLENIPQLNDLQKVVIADPSPIANDHEISRCVELTEKNKLETNSNGKDICFNDPQVPKNVAKTTKTELQLVNNMMQDTRFDNMYYYGYYNNLKAEESVASYTSIECKTLENLPQLNDMQNVVIADSAPIAHDHEISRCVELTEENKLEIDSNLKAEESAASYTSIECKTLENISQLNEMQNVMMADNLRIGKPNFNVSQDCECVEKLPKRKLKFINNPLLDASNYDNYTHIELEDNIAKNNVPYKRDCDTNMSIKELTTKVNSTAIVYTQDVGINTDDQLTSTNVKMSIRTCDVGVNTSKLVTTKNVCVNTTQQQSFQTVEPNWNISISDIFDKFIKLTRCDNEMPPSIQLALQLTIILLMIKIFLSLILWAFDNSVLICLIIFFGFYFNE